MAKGVLIIAPHDDVHAQAVYASLVRNHSITPTLWDSGIACAERRVSYTDAGFTIDNGMSVTDMNEIGSVWWRRQGRVILPKQLVDPQAKRHVNDAHNSILYSLLASMGDRVINNYLNSERADEKAFQLQIANRCGLTTPATLISNNYKDVCSFVALHRQVVVKPLVPTLGCFGEARVLKLSDIEKKPDDVSLAPTIYQEVVTPADDLRITVVGNDLFVARITKNNSTAKEYVDWRLDASSECVKDSIPRSISDALLFFMETLGLKYGAIDLRRTFDGRHVFLEINTAGQYLWVEIDTGYAISDRLALLLTDSAASEQK